VICEQALGNFSKPQKFVIPAKAGIQSLVYSTTWNGLDPRLRGDDEVALDGNSIFHGHLGAICLEDAR
jgi:hypothetical protein